MSVSLYEIEDLWGNSDTLEFSMELCLIRIGSAMDTHNSMQTILSPLHLRHELLLVNNVSGNITPFRLN